MFAFRTGEAVVLLLKYSCIIIRTCFIPFISTSLLEDATSLFTKSEVDCSIAEVPVSSVESLSSITGGVEGSGGPWNALQSLTSLLK